MKDKLVRISLQFFGEAPEEDDFDDVYYDEDAEEEDAKDELGDDGDDAEDAEDAGPEEGDDQENTGGSGEDAKDPPQEDEKGAVIAELKALGYVGDSLADLTSDMKKKREEREAAAKSRERREANAEGKAHVKSSKPGKSATGGGGGSFTERQVSGLAVRTGCTKERARELLSKHARLINGG